MPLLTEYGQYETVAASQTDQLLGNWTAATDSAGIGSFLKGLLVVPATVGAGSISISDGGGTGISVFVSGTLSSTAPFFIPILAESRVGPWSVTTGANVSVVATGQWSAK